MSFIVQCPHCNLRAPAPSRAEGASGKCLRCKNSFTLVPADDQSIPVGAPLDLADSDVEPVTESAVATAIADASDAAKEADEVAAAQAEVAVEAKAPPTPRVQLATLAGAVALLCGGVALVGASISILCFLVVPLCAIGLASGLLAVAIALTTSRRWLLVPITGAVASSAMLITALAFPGLLGPVFQHSAGARWRRSPTNQVIPQPLEIRKSDGTAVPVNTLP